MIKHFKYPYLSSQEISDDQIKLEKIFQHYHILQKISNIKKFNFDCSDLTDNEYVNLCNILINNQNYYAKHRNDVGKISTPFRIRLKENCKLQTQRPSKVPIQYRDRLNKLSVELEKYNITKQIGSTPDEKHTIGTAF